MDLRRVLRSVMMLALALLVLAPGRANAIVIWPSMPGSWVGFGQSSMVSSGPTSFPVFFDISRQERGRFSGTLLLPYLETPGVASGATNFFCDGSVQPSPENQPIPGGRNVVNASGLAEDGQLIIIIHGATVAFGDGSVRLAALRYQISDAAGALLDQGYFLLLQRIGGLDWSSLAVPAVQGNWSGDWASSSLNGLEGPLSLDVGRQLGSAFVGRSVFDAPQSPPAGPVPVPYPSIYGIEGTVGLPAVQDQTPGASPSSSPVGMIGADNANGTFVVLVGLLLPAVQSPAGELTPAAIQGNYMLYGSLEDAYLGIWRGSGFTLDQGAFELPAVQNVP